MFLGTVAWQFVHVSLPFHIQEISPYEPAATLRWTGWILGVSSLVTVFTAPFWGRWAERGNPKQLYVVVEMLQGVAFGAMALAHTLPELFGIRAALGLVGAASTFAFIMAGRLGSTAEVRRQVASVQSAMTVGQVLGPLVGAIVAARVGFRASFIVGGLLLVGCALLVRWGVDAPVARAGAKAERRGARLSEVFIAAAIILGGSAQVFFLPAILPRIMLDLGVPAAETLTMGGLVISASGVAAALGSMAAPRLAELLPERRMVPALLAVGSVFLIACGLTASVLGFGALRFLQVLCIAPVFPIVFSRIAQHASGEAIGFVNSARIGAAFVGPVVATSVLAHGSAATVYVVLAALTLACVPLAAGVWRGARPRPA